MVQMLCPSGYLDLNDMVVPSKEPIRLLTPMTASV